MPRLHAVIRGHVQGVFFRASIVEQARDLGLTGWVRNLRDGRVEWVAEGAAAPLQALVAYSRHGPPGAVVAGVSVSEEPEKAEFEAFGFRSEA